MNIEFAEEHRLVIDLVERFVEDELMPLERDVLAPEAAGKPSTLLPEEEEPLLKKCQELGLGDGRAGGSWWCRPPDDGHDGDPGTAEEHSHPIHIST